jgi:hypothetical protein
MAERTNTTPPTNAALSVLLTDIADSLIEGGKSDHEHAGIVMLAAERLRLADSEPTQEVVALITRLRQITAETHDGTTADQLKAVLGEYA